MNFEGGLKEGMDDKGFVVRYLVMFFSLFDEVVMESLVEFREKMLVYDFRVVDLRIVFWKWEVF